MVNTIKDALGGRMKAYYEEAAKVRLIRRTPVVIRLDGKAFHTFTKGFRKPFDELLAKAMQATMKYLCENVQGCVLGYTQSDEITLVLIDYAKLETSAWFDCEVQKMASVSASMATFAFNKHFNELYLDQLAEKGEADAYDLAYDAARRKGALFDSRVFNVPKEEVANCLFWRQLDAERNSAQSLAQSLFGHRELQGLSSKELIAKIEAEKGIVWGELPTAQKRGSCCVKDCWYTLDDGQNVRNKSHICYNGRSGEFYWDGDGFYFYATGMKDAQNCVFLSARGVKLDVKEHSAWRVDENIPRFVGEGRRYVEELVFVGE